MTMFRTSVGLPCCSGCARLHRLALSPKRAPLKSKCFACGATDTGTRRSTLPAAVPATTLRARGLSIDAIADILGISIGAARVRLHRERLDTVTVRE